MNRRLYLKNCFAWGLAYLVLPNPVNFAIANTQDVKKNDRQLRFNISVSNSNSHKISDASLWLYLPANTHKHSLNFHDASVNHHLEKDALNQNIIKLDIPSIGAFSTKLITLVAQIELIKESASESFDMNVWLLPERLIESNHLKIKLLAQELKQSDDLQTGYAIYKWVSEHIKYANYIPDNLGALYALNQLSGDCTEFACLAVALARANGIPARLVGGFVIEKNSVVKAKDYHHWAEIYVKEQWQVLDAQKRNWLEPASDYITFNYHQTHSPTVIEPGKRYKKDADLIIEY